MKGDLQDMGIIQGRGWFPCWGSKPKQSGLELASAPQNFSAHLKVQHANGHAFMASAWESGDLAHVHGIGISH